MAQQRQDDLFIAGVSIPITICIHYHGLQMRMQLQRRRPLPFPMESYRTRAMGRLGYRKVSGLVAGAVRFVLGGLLCRAGEGSLLVPFLEKLVLLQC